MVVIKSRLIRTIVDNYQHVLPTWMIAVTVYNVIILIHVRGNIVICLMRG